MRIKGRKRRTRMKRRGGGREETEWVTTLDPQWLRSRAVLEAFSNAMPSCLRP